MEEYNVTIVYKALIELPVKANSKEEAEIIALERFTQKRGFKDRNIILNDDNFSVEGVLNMTKTWNSL